MSGSLSEWLNKLGYSAEPEVLHLRQEDVPDAHPYALEIKSLLNPEGAIRAQAVFDVEGVPTVVFLGDGGLPLSVQEVDAARKRIWNQNLATVVIDVRGDHARALPARKLAKAEANLRLADARADGPFSALDVVSANLPRRNPNWFDVKARVDRKLLDNLSAVVSRLTSEGFSLRVGALKRKQLAEQLMGQVLFISYLEHREIVGQTYRKRRKVAPLHELIKHRDRDGVALLVDRLRVDFNGDFLGDDRHAPWTVIADEGFELLDQFLRRTDMETGQGDFWNYDFSYIPVELLSSLYESFLVPEQQAKEGAYYTPRNLAMLAVAQTLAGSDDPLSETVFDGACGSGILLTTVYRRLIALSEAKEGRKLGFVERAELLKSRIFGGDINLMACRVTAFSLYLSLLEGLDPSDILEAQEREGAKLPPLKGTNLAYGSDSADFFNDTHLFKGRAFSLIISNPPWAEPAGAAKTSADDWAEREGAPFVRRQIAGAFALRALEFLKPGGRVCLILPIGQFLGPSSSGFVSHLFGRCRPERLINFGDLQGLLFPTAENTCHVFIGARRDSSLGGIPFGERFEYCVPKADMSLALGRLTMQSADRHFLLTRSIAEDPQILVTMMWGDANDLSIWTRLTARGTFGDFWIGPKEECRWIYRKGIHLNDKSRKAVNARELHMIPFVPIEVLSAGVPVLHPDLLTSWPASHRTVVGLNSAILKVFDGPRVIFPDGFSRGEQNVRAVYYDRAASFTHSVGVIAGNRGDEHLLQFVAIYLRSSLARYFLMIRGWKMLCERNGLHLADVETFPFFKPEDAPDPQAARTALATVVDCMKLLTSTSELEQRARYDEMRNTLDDAVFSYFSLSEEECALVKESVSVLMPSIRPRSFKSLDTPAQRTASSSDFLKYAHKLGDSLTSWRARMGGHGRFTVDVLTNVPERAGPVGIVRVRYETEPTVAPEVSTKSDDQLVFSALEALRASGLRSIPESSLTLVPDTYVWLKEMLFLVRPLTQRSWTIRQALRDAERVVRAVQEKAREGLKAAA